MQKNASTDFKINPNYPPSIFNFTKKLFIETGITTAYILNYNKIHATKLPDGSYSLPNTYNAVNEKYEFDWIVGLGYNLSRKLKASLNYTQGLKIKEWV